MLVYGAICYLFVRFFLLIVLRSTRFFVEVGTLAAGNRPGTGDPGASKLDAVWRAPSFETLLSEPPPFGMAGWCDGIFSFLVTAWVALAVMLLIAFLVSFYLSGSTIIYCLLRKEVDATDYDDVYLDEDLEDEDPFATPATVATEDAGAGETATGAGNSVTAVERPPSPAPDEQEPGTDAGSADDDDAGAKRDEDDKSD
jgi:hypothetical protein